MSWQCCYTHTPANGWGPLAVSPDIPRELFSKCSRLQNANSVFSGAMLDENGQPLDLFELTGDGDNLFIMRTRYGLADAGRAIMFSHAYVLPCTDHAFIGDPNSFLTVSDENFKICGSDAEAVLGHELIRTEPLGLEEMLGRCELTDDTYRTLIRCVYAQYTDKRSVEPLFVQYDGTPEHMRALLLCIYSGLPLSVRRRLCAASAVPPGKGKRNIIFSTDARSHRLYVEPVSGKNSILQDALIRKLEKLGFVDKGAGFRTVPDGAMFFKVLEEKTLGLGDASAANERVMKIAFRMIGGEDIRTLRPEELSERMTDALLTNTLGNEPMNAYIAQLLEELMERDCILTAENEASLRRRVQYSPGRLADAAERYDFYCLQKRSPAEIGELLRSIYGTEEFGRLLHKLSESESGADVLDSFYARQLFDGRIESYEILENRINELRQQLGVNGEESCALSLRDMPRSRESVFAQALGIYEADISRSKDPGEAIASVGRAAELLGCLADTDECDAWCAGARALYWEKLSFSDVLFTVSPTRQQYRRMSADTEKCRMFLEFVDLYMEFCRAHNAKHDEEYFRHANRYFKNLAGRIEVQELGRGVERLTATVGKVMLSDDAYGESWCRALLTAESGMLDALLRLYAAVQGSSVPNIQRNYLGFLRACEENGGQPELRGTLSPAVLTKCRRIDSLRSPVTLDLWLSLSGNVYGNAFEVFNRIEARICELDPVVCVAESELMQQERITRQAKECLAGDCPQSALIKKWLSIARKMGRRSPEKYEEAQNETGAEDTGGKSRFALFGKKK